MKLPDFDPVSRVPQSTVDAMRVSAPAEILDIWEHQGLGTCARGFLKVIDPVLYIERLGAALPPGVIPFFASGMADVLAWDPGHGHLTLFRYRYGDFVVAGVDFEYFDVFLEEGSLLEDEFVIAPYDEAVAVHGPLEYEQCFGYVPMLAAGGPELVSHLEKVDLIQHVRVITELAGPIEYY